MIGMTGRNAVTTTATIERYAGLLAAGTIRRRVGPVLGVLCLTLALTACGGGSGSGSSNGKDDTPPADDDPTIEDPVIDPVACFTSAVVGLNVQTDASCSQGESLEYAWEWGDGGEGGGVSAQHDYEGAGTYHISLTVSDGERADTVTQSVSVNDSVVEDGARVVNPFHGADAYINQDYAALVETSATRVDGSLAARMRQLAEEPTAVWLDRIEAIHGGAANAGRKSLEQHLDAALVQKREGVPLTASFVVYNLPDRDCAAYASNGTLHADQNGLQRYREEYIDVIVNTFAQPRFRDLRIVAVIEPDSLPNLVTNLDLPNCAKVAADNTYVDGIRYAIQQLSQLPNVYLYLDIAHSGWLGWDNNFTPAVQLYTDVVAGAAGGDLSVISGFVSNVANYTPTSEPYLPNPELRLPSGGNPVRASTYYEWNPYFDEIRFTQALHQAFRNAGFPATTGMLIDTSRNGWGGAARPSGPAPTSAVSIDAYVDASRVDRRHHRGNWCNAAGAGVGERPRAYPLGEGGHLHAYVWVKPPGEADGTSDSSQTTPDEEGKRFDAMCDPNHIADSGYPTGALPGAPTAGHWFHEQFRMLVENAHPPLD